MHVRRTGNTCAGVSLRCARTAYLSIKLALVDDWCVHGGSGQSRYTKPSQNLRDMSVRLQVLLEGKLYPLAVLGHLCVSKVRSKSW